MASGIYLAMAGSVAQQQAIDVTSNNIANASTVGFRADRFSFQQALAGARKDSTSVQSRPSATDETAGAIESTGNPLDVALRGGGYLVVQHGSGERLTRGGSLRVDAQAQLTTVDGSAVLSDSSQPIRIPAGTRDVVIASDGRVSADGVELGRLKIVTATPGSVRHEGASMFVTAGKLSAAPATTECVTGALEQSNFNVVRGMVDLVRISRTYEALHRMIESYKQIDDRSARIGNG